VDYTKEYTMKSADHAVRTAVALAISGAVAHLGLFLLLHVIEPEYDPRWRFVSEYSNGQYGLVMRLAFVSAAVATVGIVMMLRRAPVTKLTKAATVALIVSAIGLALAACFSQDPVTSKVVTTTGNLHGLAALLGIPGLGIGGLLTGLWLRKRGFGLGALVICLLPLASFVAMVVYLFGWVLPEPGFVPGTYTGVFNRVYIVASVVTYLYMARVIPAAASTEKEAPVLRVRQPKLAARESGV
jgi:Protein of unknown function (DUF998)